ncbi:MAG: hypothetical protein K8R53_16415 [Bacteroidales bacterium]|nr:hypothetical protein [Bacteroidales bacterium]
MAINEDFIRKVFTAMVEYKPRLKAFLDDSDEDFDIRELSNNIIKSYPWPVGIELRRLLSGNTEQFDRGKLDQIFKTIERTMQFLSFVLLIQLLEESLKKDIILPESFKKDFPNRFSTLTMGDLTWLTRTVYNIMADNKIEPFMGETESIFTKIFFNNLDFWVPERNEIGHYQINLTDGETEVRCHEYLEKLGDILVDVAFLIKYPLISIAEINLIKRKREKEHYNHNMLLLNSSSSSFMGKMEEFSKFTDTHAVLLVKSIKNAPYQFLNLSPLIIDTNNEKMESREKLTRLKKDIYLYSKWDKKSERLFYVGTEATEKIDIRLLSFYDQLVREYSEILQVLGST